jgi:hypothetical protein
MSQKKLAAISSGITYCASPAWHKGHCCQGQGKDKAVQTQKGWMLGKRCQMKLRDIIGIRDRDKASYVWESVKRGLECVKLKILHC